MSITDPSESPNDAFRLDRKEFDRADARGSSKSRRRAVLSYEQLVAGVSGSGHETGTVASVRVEPLVSAGHPVARDPIARPTSPLRAPRAARPVLEIVALNSVSEPARQRETSSGQAAIEPVEPTAHPQRNTAEVSAAFPERLQLSPAQRAARYAAMRNELSRR